MCNSKVEVSKESQKCLAVGKILKENKTKSKKKTKTTHQYLEIFGIKRKIGSKSKNLCTYVNVLLKIRISNVANELENG